MGELIITQAAVLFQIRLLTQSRNMAHSADRVHRQHRGGRAHHYAGRSICSKLGWLLIPAIWHTLQIAFTGSTEVGELIITQAAVLFQIRLLTQSRNMAHSADRVHRQYRGGQAHHEAGGGAHPARHAGAGRQEPLHRVPRRGHRCRGGVRCAGALLQHGAPLSHLARGCISCIAGVVSVIQAIDAAVECAAQALVSNMVQQNLHQVLYRLC